jgi:hypothetical protein
LNTFNYIKSKNPERNTLGWTANDTAEATGIWGASIYVFTFLHVKLQASNEIRQACFKMWLCVVGDALNLLFVMYLGASTVPLYVAMLMPYVH